MAKIVANKNSLNEEIKRINAKRNREIFIWGIVVLLSVLLEQFIFTFILGIIAFFRMLSLASPHSKVESMASGLEGEEYAISTLRKLPDEYTVICDVNIEVDGGKSQLDFVVVGPTGIFVTEIKNWNGTIYGSEEEKEWRQDKVGRKGGEYSRHYYNPGKQVRTHVYRLSKLLKNNGLNSWVQGIVYFTHPRVEIHVETNKVPVFAEPKNDGYDLLKYIQSEDNESLTEKQINDIENLLVSESNLEGTA
ncbi:nuclease-related domain-containing protein [Proteinivorax tanatarense]|uniref:Nuclease-related domain-containing protein n=1 Tax=Proteinivorax tanatarense TaxID=1260629 RepID=A0AAU7VHH6_9FIRM